MIVYICKCIAYDEKTYMAVSVVRPCTCEECNVNERLFCINFVCLSFYSLVLLIY